MGKISDNWPSGLCGFTDEVMTGCQRIMVTISSENIILRPKQAQAKVVL